MGKKLTTCPKVHNVFYEIVLNIPYYRKKYIARLSITDVF